MADNKARKFETSLPAGLKLAYAGQPKADGKEKSGPPATGLPGQDTPEGRTLILLRLIDRLKAL